MRRKLNHVRVETRIGTISFALFLAIKNVISWMSYESNVLHFGLGGLAGLALLGLVIGGLPEVAYERLKQVKAKLFGMIRV